MTTEKGTGDFREKLKILAAESLPRDWDKFRRVQMELWQWIKDFGKRAAQLNTLESGYITAPDTRSIWLGGLFQPEGLVAATRQFIGSKTMWPLEQMDLDVIINKSSKTENGFMFDQLRLFGADWDRKTCALTMTTLSSVTLPTTTFRWFKKGEEPPAPDGQYRVEIPVYLNSTFRQLLFSVRFMSPVSIPEEIWALRSVSLVVWST